MSAKKREALTTDDLLRFQEDGPRKRQRASTDSEEEEHSESNSESEPELEIPDKPKEPESSFSSRFNFKSREQVNAQPGPSKSPSHTTNFTSMGVTPTLISALTKLSIQTPTEIQAACIPPLFEGKPNVSPHEL